MKRLLLVLLLLPNLSSAQIMTSYCIGDSLLSVGKFEEALKGYDNALNNATRESTVFKNTYLYNKACCYSLLHQLDSAFDCLRQSLQLSQTSYFIWEYDLFNMHGDPRWADLVNNYRTYFYEKRKDFPHVKLAYELETMYSADVSLRNILTQPRFKLLQKELWRQQLEIDSQNVLRLVEIIDSIGWPNWSSVGKSGAKAAFLILQHAPVELQKRYVPLMEVEAKHGRINPIHLGYVIDRIQLREGKPQVYGTQINVEGQNPEPYPVIDPPNLNTRRKSIGLPVIEEYLKEFSAYKK